MRRLLFLTVAFPLLACGPSGGISAVPTPNFQTIEIGSCVAQADTNYAPVRWSARSLPEIAAGLSKGEITSQVLVGEYLQRIHYIDITGPRLQSILTLNPDAMAQAMAIDERRANGETLGPLAGIPILLKDNIETADNMPTTAGAVALKDNITGRDSPLVARLRESGAIILGKTNLSQWANFRSNKSISGWTALGGQVRNPYMLDRSPCGSSSGSGAAAAASLAAGAIGTETNGSIICPANANGVVGFKPSVGLVSQEHIIPISASQDTAGPMTKTVKGAAMMLTGMATDGSQKDYAARLDRNALSGKTIGVMRFSQGDNPDILERFNAALDVMESQGARLVDIDDFDTPDGFRSNTLPVLEYEFKDGLNKYLESTPSAVATRSLAELIAFNETEPSELALFDQDLFEESEAKGPLTDTDYKEALALIQKATREDGIDKLMTEYNLDMLVSPSGPIATRVDPINGDVWPDWVGAGYLAAVAGYPHITVPMGHVHGVPLGISIMGSANQDADIINYGYAYEQASQMRRDPLYLNTAEDCQAVEAAMTKK